MGLVSPTQYGPRSVAQHHGAITRAAAKSMVEAKNPHPHAAAGPDACSEWYGQALDTVDPALARLRSAELRALRLLPARSARRYGFTDIIRKGNDGAGQKIAIVDAFLSPTLLVDAQTYAANNDRTTR